MKSFKAIINDFCCKSECGDDENNIETNIITDSQILLPPRLIYTVSKAGMGKTTLALDIVLQHSNEIEGKVIIISPEKTAEEVLKRLITKLCGDEISSEGRRKANLKKAIKYFSNLNIFVEDFEEEKQDSVKRIKDIIEGVSKGDFVFIDSLDCLWTKGRGKMITVEEKVNLSKCLKRAAIEKNISILVSCYINEYEKKRIFTTDLPDFLKPVDTVLLLERRTQWFYDQIDYSAELSIIDTDNESFEKTTLGYNGIKRCFSKIV